jgi:hypothetical protein
LQRWQGKSGLPNLADNKFETWYLQTRILWFKIFLVKAIIRDLQKKANEHSGLYSAA